MKNFKILTLLTTLVILTFGTLALMKSTKHQKKDKSAVISDSHDFSSEEKENSSPYAAHMEQENNGFTENPTIMKAIFSGILLLAALFVILSKKYDDETKKWAYSVLTLIAGVWIGSAT